MTFPLEIGNALSLIMYKFILDKKLSHNAQQRLQDKELGRVRQLQN